MRIIRDMQDADAVLRGGAVTVGNFDGVHRGHALLLETARRAADGRAVVAVTFEPHPIRLLAPDRAPPRLTPPEEKLRLLESCGASAAIVLPTDALLLATPAEAFVEHVIVARLRPAHWVEGPTFGFGSGRRGGVGMLAELSAKFGYQLHVVAPASVKLDGEDGACEVSSSLVRRLLDAGRVEAAAACLGRPYALLGRVVGGAGQGRMLGFPTINLDAAGQQWPGDGVYAGLADVDGQAGAAAISVGTRPTLGGGQRVVEAFLLDRTGDYYGGEARLTFEHRVREQRLFASPEALAAQIAADVEQVRRLMHVS